ncbi:WecB/TagA/CpsF family glycosyltransferase [Brevibacillus ginsengisoli]|uniref:WecB/TagA/CpsF family glycosyltransferase n=1 Tax=Brevibacillus ginsengisoli TaxID=363854 RepID=UPI003CF171F4
MKVVRILGVPFQTNGFNETVADLTARIQSRERTHVVTANPEVVMIANEDQQFRQIVEQAYVVPDGIGIVYAAKILDYPITERVTGIELLEGLMEQANKHEWKVFLLGASPEVNKRASTELAHKYPNARIVGAIDGYFTPEEEAKIASEVAASQADILFTALGAPKQDVWISKYWDRLQVSLAMGVGGSFDVLAGTVKRAPSIWQKLHLEWLYRLMKQPSRWKRQLAIPRFILAVLQDKKR